MITRREALWSLASMVGLPGWLPRLIEQASSPGVRTGSFLSPTDLAHMTRLCDGILPAVGSSGGALAAGSPAFIDSLLFESDANVQQPFSTGLASVVRYSQIHSGNVPGRLTESTLRELISSLDGEAKRVAVEPQMTRLEDGSTALMPSLVTRALATEDRTRVEFYVSLRCLVITGYVSSALFTPQMFHVDYAGCSHPEHHASEGK